MSPHWVVAAGETCRSSRLTTGDTEPNRELTVPTDLLLGSAVHYSTYEYMYMYRWASRVGRMLGRPSG